MVINIGSLAGQYYTQSYNNEYNLECFLAAGLHEEVEFTLLLSSSDSLKGFLHCVINQSTSEKFLISNVLMSKRELM